MRILVGTLFCGENELQECCDSLKSQTHTDWEQFVLRDLPNKIAHETLYETFMGRADDFDLFLKLDADMVLEDPTMLSRIEDYFHEHTQLDGITICVHDFYADELIHGMHVYRSSVVWNKTHEMIFVDDTPVSSDKFRIDVRELAPAASHCKNPSPFFALRFGIHRGIKAREGLAGGGSRRSAANYYLQTIEQVWRHFRRNPDKRLGMAVIGAEMSLAGDFTIDDVDPKSAVARAFTEELNDLSDAELALRLDTLRRHPITKIPLRRLRISRYRISRLTVSVIHGAWPAFVSLFPRKLRTAIRDRIGKSPSLGGP